MIQASVVFLEHGMMNDCCSHVRANSKQQTSNSQSSGQWTVSNKEKAEGSKQSSPPSGIGCSLCLLLSAYCLLVPRCLDLNEWAEALDPKSYGHSFATWSLKPDIARNIRFVQVSLGFRRSVVFYTGGMEIALPQSGRPCESPALTKRLIQLSGGSRWHTMMNRLREAGSL
jgi:hypothetical protein